MIWYLNSKLDLNLLRQGLLEPEFYGDLVYKLKKIVGFYNFPAQFIKIFSHYNKIGYNIIVLLQTACLVVNLITVGNFAFLFNCTPVGQISDSMMVPTKRLIYWQEGRGLVLWLLSVPKGFTCWLSFAQVFRFIYCWVLIFALTPFYILIYVSRRWCFGTLGVFHANQTSMGLDRHLN